MRNRRLLGDGHLFRQFEDVAGRFLRADLGLGGIGIEPRQHRIDILLAVFCCRMWRWRRRRFGSGRCARCWNRCSPGWCHGFRRCARRLNLRLGRNLSTSRLGLVVSDDTPDRRQNFLHRGLLRLCRLRHRRPHITAPFWRSPRRNNLLRREVRAPNAARIASYPL